MHNAFDMTSQFADASRSQDFLPGLVAVCRSNCQQVQHLLLFKQIVDGLYLLMSLNTLLQSILFSNLSRLVLLNMLCWTTLSIR